jgi:hypothetical protein
MWMIASHRSYNKKIEEKGQKKTIVVISILECLKSQNHVKKTDGSC